jgi:hypothetical protein
MIGTIGSLVQETTHRFRWLLATSLYTLACLATAGLLGFLLGTLGHAIRSAMMEAGLVAPVPHAGMWLVGALGLAYAASDLGLVALPRPILLPAVPLWWWRRYQPYGAAVAYGAALGLGVTTRVWFGSFYVLCAWCMLRGDPLYAALLMGTFGALRALVMFPASWGLACHRSDVVGWLSGPLFDLTRARHLVAVALTIFATLTLALALTPAR